MRSTRAMLALTLSGLLGCAGGAPLAEGDTLSAGEALAVTDMAGAVHDLDARLARGAPVALVFWQTWCESCAQEAPIIAQAARAYGEQVQFLGVISGQAGTVDDDEVRAVAARWGYEAFPQVRDPELRLAARLGVTGTPTVVILGAERRVLFHGHRPPSAWEPYLTRTPSTDPGEDCPGGVCPLPAPGGGGS